MKRASALQKTLFAICTFVLGVVFIFSGTVKAIDPLGSVYKIEDYLEALNLYSLDFLSMFAAFCLFTFEALAGWLLLTRINLKWGLILTTAFMAVMTPLTLWIAIANPVSDCGCFGDAIILSNTATFWKNIAIDVLLVVAWILYKRAHKAWLLPAPEWIATCIFAAAYIIFGIATLRSIPVLDFRPYRIGVNIAEAMTLPPDAKRDVYHTTCIYRHADGTEQEFDLQDIPYNDSTWTFVTQNTELIQKGDEPKIHDFSITEIEFGDDITDEVLAEHEVWLFIMWDLRLTDAAQVKKLNRLYDYASEKGIPVYALTASLDLIAQFTESTGARFPFALTDPIQLKTIVRANPGVVIMREGTIVDKFNARARIKDDKTINEIINP